MGSLIACGCGHPRPEHPWHDGASGRSAAHDHPDGRSSPPIATTWRASMGMLTGDDSPATCADRCGKYLKMFIGTAQWGRLTT